MWSTYITRRHMYLYRYTCFCTCLHQSSTNCAILPSQMGEHGVRRYWNRPGHISSLVVFTMPVGKTIKSISSKSYAPGEPDPESGENGRTSSQITAFSRPTRDPGWKFSLGGDFSPPFKLWQKGGGDFSPPSKFHRRVGEISSSPCRYPPHSPFQILIFWKC